MLPQSLRFRQADHDHSGIAQFCGAAIGHNVSHGRLQGQRIVAGHLAGDCYRLIRRNAGGDELAGEMRQLLHGHLEHHRCAGPRHASQIGHCLT